MPSRPRNPCTQPGCSALVRSGRCPEHASQARAQRDTKAYGTSRWQRIRKAFLYTHPWCNLCGAQATVADHYPLSRKALAARGIDPDTPTHLRPLCTPCHNKETARHQPGGWAAEKAKPKARE